MLDIERIAEVTDRSEETVKLLAGAVILIVVGLLIDFSLGFIGSPIKGAGTVLLMFLGFGIVRYLMFIEEQETKRNKDMAEMVANSGLIALNKQLEESKVQLGEKDKLAKECERLRAESKRQLADMQTLKGELQTAQEGLADAHTDMTDDRLKLSNAKEELRMLKVNIANAESGKANAEKANSERIQALNERLQALAPYQQYYDLTAKDKGYKGIINSSSSTPEQKEKARGEREPIKARLAEIEATLNRKGASDE